MAFRFTGRHAIILSVVIVLVLAIAVTLVANKPSSKFFKLGHPNLQFPNLPNYSTSGNPLINNTEGPEKEPQNQSSVTSQTYVEPLVYEKFGKGDEWVRVWVILKNADKTQETISRISNGDFELDERSVSTASFSGNITRRGLEVLSTDPNVDKIYLSVIGSVQLDTSVPLIAVRDAVWNLDFIGTTKTICVIDTGIDYFHPDLGGCFGNGTNFSCKVIDGYNFHDDNANPIDDHGHGTHVAGIISSSNNTYRGVAYGSKLVALKVCNSAGGDCQDGFINKSIEWCLNNSAAYNISVISISIGNGGEYPPNCPDGLRGAITNANDAGIPVVIASGNNGHEQGISHPACVPGAISVGAVYDNNLGREPDGSAEYCLNDPCTQTCHDDNAVTDNFTCFSNRGSNLSLLAPGCRINSTNYSAADVRDRCGTSMAAPHVSGAIALLLQLKPDLTSEQMRDVLNITGKEIIDAGYSNFSFRRIDVFKAISAVNDSLLRVNSLSVINYSGLSHFLAFTIQNANLSNITNISWSADMGDGTKINSTYNITQLLFHETALVRLKHNYSSNGIYIVNVSTRAGNLLHSRNITVYVGNVIVYDLKEINYSGWQRTFQFSVRNNLNTNITSLNWSLNFGEGTITSGNQLFTLGNKTDIFFRVRQNYSRNGAFTVTANATNITYSHSKSMNITIA